jgi:hypothetical protein
MSDIIEIRLSPTTPGDVIQRIRARAVDPTSGVGTPAVHQGTVELTGTASARFLAEVHLSLIPPAQPKTGKESLEFTLKLAVAVAGIAYYVSGTPHHIVEFLEDLKPYIQETRTVEGNRIVPLDQVITNLKKPSPLTPKNGHHEQSPDSTKSLSRGD